MELSRAAVGGPLAYGRPGMRPAGVAEGRAPGASVPSFLWSSY